MPNVFLIIDVFSIYGRMHPALVHIPIGAFSVALVISFFKEEKRENANAVWSLSLLITAISAVLSCIAGYLLSGSGEYDQALVFKHQWTGIATAVISLLAYVMQQHRRWLVWLTGCAMLVAGHLGGTLTHGEGYLMGSDKASNQDSAVTQQIDSTKPVVIDSSKLQQKLSTEVFVYRDQIEPILKQKCYSCHSNIKMKGGLRLDNETFIIKGGKHGRVLIPGDANQSKMYASLLLPEEDDHHMPPKGKKQLTLSEINLIHHWIGRGAPFGGVIVESKRIEPLSKPLPEEVVTVEASPKVIIDEKIVISAPDQDAINSLKSSGVVVLPSTNHPQLLSLNFVNVKSIDQQMRNSLNVLKENIGELKISNLAVQQDLVMQIAGMKNITKLQLTKSGLTDGDLQILSGLKHLEFLNVYGNPITDKGIEYFSAANLKSLYIWNTKVSKQGLDKLQNANMKLQIETGNIGFVKPDSSNNK